MVAKMRPPENDRRANSSCLRCSRYHGEMLITKNEPRTNAPVSVCVSRSSVDGLKTTPQKSAVSARIVCKPFRVIVTILWPAGVCCQLFATIIHTAENIDPIATIHVARKWNLGVTLSQPKTSTARKPDSRKNAKIPSAASAEPNTSPTNREYGAQFVPN